MCIVFTSHGICQLACQQVESYVGITGDLSQPAGELVEHEASGDIALPASLLQATRGWDDDEWEAGHERLREKGYLTRELTLTVDGRAARTRVEDLTDAASIGPWSALSAPEAAELRELSSPFTKIVAKAMFNR